MSTIYNISPGFLQTCVNYLGKSNMSMEEVFKRLSFEMGGDGKSITKAQLDKYIDKADSGALKIDKSKINALKEIQKNWDTISEGEDTITYENMKNYSTLLAATLSGGFNATEIEDSKSSANDAIFDYLIDYLGVSDKDKISESDLTAYLNELIANSEADDSNSELIGALTNLIATYSANSTVETEA